MKTRNEAERLASTPHHELRNATAVSGAVVGATVGIVGGIAGIGAAGLLGAVIGALGGLVLERENRRAEAHDRELDRIAGVTTTDLGASEAAAEGLTRLEVASTARTARAEAELLAMEAKLDRAPCATTLPAIEPACPDCIDVRRASAGAVGWCARHSMHHPRPHLHYEYPQRFGVGSLLLRPES